MKKPNPYKLKCACGEHCVRKLGDTCRWCKRRDKTYYKAAQRRKVYVRQGWE